MPEENTYEMPADNLKIEEAYVNDNPDLEELGFEQEASSPKRKKESDVKKDFSEILPQSYIEMDEQFLTYLKNFNDIVCRQENLKNELKEKFFYLVMIFMALIILFPFFLVIMFRSRVTDVALITLSISSLAETLSAIIILPKIIAKYLFNKKEEENKIQIISNMQLYNKEKQYKSEGIYNSK